MILKYARLALLAAGFALTVAACAQQPAQWRKPGAPEAEWDRDTVTCRSIARRKAAEDFRARASQVGSPAYDRSRTYERSMAEYEAKRAERRLFEDCLRARGYVKVDPATEKEMADPGK